MEDERVAEALQRAHERVLEVLHPLVASATQFFAVTIRADYDEEGLIRLVIEIEAPRRFEEKFGALIDEAAEQAARAFEEALGVRVTRRVRLVPVQGEGQESSSIGSQERRSRRDRRSRRGSGAPPTLRG